MNLEKKYYTLAFLEGILVMAFELVVARLMAPFFGSSLYVLTTVLGITMLALLSGYFIGGRIVNNGFKIHLPLIFLIIVSSFLSLLPSYSLFLLDQSMNLGLVTGALFAATILLGIPLCLLGMVSPMLIELINHLGLKAGTASGNVYAISTLGGVVSTFLIGLLFIPNIGVKLTAILIGLTVGVLALIFISIKRSRSSISLAFLLLFTSVLGYTKHYFPIPAYSNCIYSSDGLLGRLDVCDLPNGIRVLSNNGTTQSKINVESGLSIMPYNHVLATASSLVLKENRENAVLLGLAGGSLIKELKNLGFQNVTAVDIDPRTKEISEKFFSIDSNSFEFIQDDGRHYLASTQKTFDLIIIDVSNSEQQPYHLYTKEAFEIYTDRLSNNGIIILNIIDFIGEDRGIIVDKISDAMAYLNLSPRLLKDFYPTGRMKNDDMTKYVHERIIIGSKDYFDQISEDQNDLTLCCAHFPYNVNLKINFWGQTYERKKISSDGFSDDIPEMEKLNFYRIRKLRNKNFIQ